MKCKSKYETFPSMKCHVTSSHKNTFRITGPFVRGIHRSLMDSSHKGPMMRTFPLFPLMFAWINHWTSSRVASDKFATSRQSCIVTVNGLWKCQQNIGLYVHNATVWIDRRFILVVCCGVGNGRICPRLFHNPLAQPSRQAFACR